MTKIKMVTGLGNACVVSNAGKGHSQPLISDYLNKRKHHTMKNYEDKQGCHSIYHFT